MTKMVNSLWNYKIMINSWYICYFASVIGKKTKSKTRFQPDCQLLGFEDYKERALKGDSNKTNFETMIIIPFSEKIKRKYTYEKEKQDIHITRITTSFGCQKVNFLIFLDVYFLNVT